jgi:hypothetical protein
MMGIIGSEISSETEGFVWKNEQAPEHSRIVKVKIRIILICKFFLFRGTERNDLVFSSFAIVLGFRLLFSPLSNPSPEREGQE